MKIVLLVMSLMFLMGCGSIQKQSMINEKVQSHVYEASPEVVFEAASGVFDGKLQKEGDMTGETEWVVNDTKLGEKEYQERQKYQVKVEKVKDGTSLKIMRMTSSNISGDWGETQSVRWAPYERQVLKKLEPQKLEAYKMSAEQSQ